MELNKTYCGNALDVLRTFPDNFFDCVVTSPPYWGLRDYGTAVWVGGKEDCDHKGKPHRTRSDVNKHTNSGGDDVKNQTLHNVYKSTCAKCGAKRIDLQLGLEEIPEEYISKLVEVFEEVYRILKPTGTVWINIGDTYASRAGGYDHTGSRGASAQISPKTQSAVVKHKQRKPPAGIKEKDLVGIPWMLAFALRAAGWYLRSDIIWHKPNPMPESTQDRPTKSHEHVFLLAKSAKYYYDAEAIKTETGNSHDAHARVARKRFPTEKVNGIRKEGYYPMANKRDVWTIGVEAFPDAHFATFPTELAATCIKAGTSEKGCCSECGKPWTRVVEKSGGSIGSGSWTKHVHDDTMGMMAGNTTAAKKLMRNKTYEVKTVGWHPTCKCKADVVPARVLDTFNGSGTVRMVAEKLGRDSAGVELNPKYITIEKHRRKKEFGLFEPTPQPTL